MKISVIGAAGYVGSNAAIIMALDGLGDEIILVDPYKQNMVEQLAMDTATAATEQGTTVRAGDFPDIKDSDIVVVAAGAAQGLIASRMEMLPKNLPIMRDIALEIKKSAPDAIVITASNPVDPLNYAMYKFTGFDRSKVIGYSLNDATRFRMMLAEILGEKTADVEGMVLGEHGDSQVLVFSSAKVKGNKIEIDNETKDKIRSGIPLILKRYEELKTGRTAGVTSGEGLKEVVKAIINNSGKIFREAAILQGEYGQNDLCMGVPVALGSSGIQEIIELELAAEEKPLLEGTLKVLKDAMNQVNEFVKSN